MNSLTSVLWTFKLLSVSSYVLMFFFFSICLCSADNNDAETSICTDWAPVNSSATWKENLNNVLNSLGSNVDRNGGFYTAESGQNNSDRMYGLIQCRGDISPSNCSDCTQESFRQASTNCNSSTVSLSVWQRWCFLRYSNTSFFGKWEGSGSVSTYGPRDDPTVVVKGRRLMERVMDAASNNTMRFAMSEIDDARGGKRYGMAQCTRDLRTSDCRDCLDVLRVRVNNTYADQRVWKAHAQGCAMWYDDYQFYFTTRSSTNPSAPPTVPPSSSTADYKFRGVIRLGMISITISLTALASLSTI